MPDPTSAGRAAAGHHRRASGAASADKPSSLGVSATAFERLARERRGALLHAARRGSRRPEDVEDAVQEALTRAFARRQQIRAETAFAYVAVSAMHEASRLRHTAERCESLDAPAAREWSTPLVECQPARELDVDGLLDALDGLRAVKHDEARAVMARALGWSYAEIGAAFGWT